MLNKKGEIMVGTGVKILAAVVVGSLLLFGTYAVVTLIPFSQMAVLTTKIIADILINNDDFNPSNLKNYLSEIKTPLDTYLSTGKYQEAIEFLKEQQKLKRYAKDYRICIEIATIAMSNLNDLKLAMSEYSRVLVITKKDLFLLTPIK